MATRGSVMAWGAPSVLLGAALMLGGCLPTAVPTPAPGFDSCGAEDVGAGEFYNEDGRRCLLAAYQAGHKAEFATTGRTVEGDRVSRIIRVHARGVVEVVHDDRQDRFGSGHGERLQCEALVAVEEVNNPPDLVYPSEMVFIEDGCRDWSDD